MLDGWYYAEQHDAWKRLQREKAARMIEPPVDPEMQERVARGLADLAKSIRANCGKEIS